MTQLNGRRAGFTYAHTSDFRYIDSALKARWLPFIALEAELEKFVPRQVADFAGYREEELARLQLLNPTSSKENLLELIDGQILANANPNTQFHLTFGDRIMSEYVTVAFLAHALAEATVNAILAIGLATAGAEEVFSIIERSDIQEKWAIGPKTIDSAYTLQKGSTLFQTLRHLTRQRNAFVHYKIELEMDGERKLRGSQLDRAPLGTQVTWIRRFFSLPYDLAFHARSQLQHVVPLMLLNDCRPIQRFAAHTVV